MSTAEPRVSSLFEDAIDIPPWLHSDRAMPFAVRSERDRAIGLGSIGDEPIARVRGWWRHMDAPHRSDGHRLARLRAQVLLALIVIGALFGAGLAFAALSYDGQHPVNMVTALALLVALPLLFLAASLIVVADRLPGFEPIRRTLALASIGSLVTGLLRRFLSAAHGGAHAGTHEGLGEGAGPLDFSLARRGPARQFARWQVVLWSQVAGLSFSVAAIAISLALVVFTDLAFGWSTTLELDNEEAKSVVDLIATPWSAWLPMLVPDAQLIEDSRFFRLEGAQGTGVDADRLTGWWPFLLSSILVYGFLPRLVVLLVARGRLRSATAQLLMSEPEVRALLDRMDTPMVALRSQIPETPGDACAATEPASVHVVNADEANWRVLVWNQALTGELRTRWLDEHLGVEGACLEVGGGNAIEDDLKALSTLANDDAPVAVLTKAWEPPLGDFRDLLAHLRSQLGPDRSIVVLPVGLDATAPSPEELAMWRHGIAPLGDSAAYIEGLGA